MNKTMKNIGPQDKRVFSPLRCEILMHIYSTPSKIPNQDFEAQKTELKTLEDWGAIREAKDCESGWCITGHGKAWVSSILSTRMPSLAYLSEHGEVVGHVSDASSSEGGFDV